MADEKKVSGKTRAGGAAKPFPWEEAIAEQYERTKSRLKGLATEPEAELQRILEQYLPKKGDSREERMQKLKDLAMGFAGTTKLPTPKLARASELVGTPAQRAAEQGYMDYLHGTERLDRLLEGKSFDPKRATSGPMPFGTTGKELASSYAMGKPDTSRIAEDFGEMKNYFQILPKDIGLSGRNLMSAEDAWRFLPKEKQVEILDKAKRIGYENPQEATGRWVLHEGSEGMPFSESHWNYVLNKESGGNPLTALRKVYAESGTLDPYAPSELADIYRLAGFNAPISQVNAPWTEAKGVFLGKARITNPLNTTDIDVLQNKVIPALKEEFKNDRTRKKPFGADQWDKNVRFTPKEWVDELERDIAAGGNSYVWTSIPDKVTKALKDKLGYNGIIDTSGKGGTGTSYPVVIPFEPGQIRSRFAAFDPEKVGKPDLLAAAVPVGLLGSTQVDLPKKQEKKPAPQVKKAEGGLAQYGLRHSGEGVKGKGYFGPMAGRDGTVTELSAEDESGEYPLVVPTLTAEELDRLLAGGEPTPEMLDKASSWAATRRKRGESPFASPTEVRMPRPKAEGGVMDTIDSMSLLDEDQLRSLEEYRRRKEEELQRLEAELKQALDRQYWADRGPNSADELVLEDRPDYRLRKAVEAQYGMSTAIPSYLEKAPPFQLNENYLIDPEFVEERQSRRFYKKGGAVKKAEGGSLTDLPDEVNPSNWREHLQNNVRADARALLGAKDGGAINLDNLIEQALKKKDGGVINLDELIDWTLAKAEHRKMKEGGAVKMADGGQTFPLQRPEEVTDLKPRPRTKRDELLEMLSKGVGSVHEFMAKPFGYENPPGEMVSSLIGLPGTAKTLERMAYGDPLTSGAGMTTNLLPETTEAAFLGLGAAPTALKMTKNLPVGMSIKPTTTDLLDLELASKMKASPTAVVPEAKAGKVKAPANPVGFYNPAEKAALNLQRKKGSGSAFISDLKKQPGVTDERIAELGLTDLASNPNVTREDVIAAVEQNRIPLRESVRSESSGDAMFAPSAYPDYNMPGGENYREIRVIAPYGAKNAQNIQTLKNPSTGKDVVQFEYNGTRFAEELAEGDSVERAIERRINNPKKGTQGAVDLFMHPTHHGDEPNVLFHLRVANHVDEEGKRGLLIDELQSDWHQKGRDKGYGRQPSTFMLVNPETSGAVGNFATKEEAEKFLKTSPRAEEFAQGKFFVFENKGKVVVPDAPFKDNWYQLGLKRAIKEAVDTGMDRVYLTTGARQADRYDLSKHIDRIDYNKNPDGSYNLSAIKNGSEVLAKEELTLAEVEQLVGKDMAKKMTAGEGKSNVPADRWEPEDSEIPQYKTLSGLDLKVGGEGMKQYYDKNYKNYLEKYAKQHGGKLGKTKLPGAAVTRDQLSTKDIENMMGNPEFKKILDEEFIRVANEPPVTGRVEPQGDGYFKIVWSDGRVMGGYSEESAKNRLALGREFRPTLEARVWNAALNRFGGEPVYYIDITDAMRESAKKGQSYADGGGVFNTDPDITDAGRIIPEHTI